MKNKKNFNNDSIENYLLSLGVSIETIQSNKTELAKSDSDYYYFYDLIPEKWSENTLVPLEKVKGISRVSGYSWFTIFRYLSQGLPNTIPSTEFNLNTHSFNRLMEIVHQGGKKAYDNFCQDTYHVCFRCYEKYGKQEYFQSTDGNHRVIVSKNLGIEEINATNVSYYNFNPVKYRQYTIFNTLYSEILENTEKARVKIIKDSSPIEILLDNSCDYLCYEKLPYDEFPVFDYSYENVEAILLKMQQINNKYSYINKKSTQYQKFLTRLPLFVLRGLFTCLTLTTNETKTNNNLALLVALFKVIKKFKY